MAQSIQIDIKGNAGSLLKALKQSETAMSKLAQSTNRLSGVRIAGTTATSTNTKSVVQNTDAQTRNAAATRNNATAQQNLGGSLAQTTSRLGQANAGFYNIGFAIEDAGQFANGFSAGMRAIGNNLSAIALSLSASGAKFSDFLGFLRGPGGLIIAISAFTAAAQLVPPLLEKMDGLFGGVGKSAGDSVDGIGRAADEIERVGDSATDSAEYLDELRSAFAEFIKLRDESAEFAEIGIDEARRRLGILESETEFLSNQKALAEATLKARQGINAQRGGAQILVKLTEEQARFQTLTTETLERIIAESEEELLIMEAQTEEMREQIRNGEARERVIQRLVDQGFELKQIEEDISGTKDEILKTDEYIAKGIKGLKAVSIEALEVDRIREQVSKRIENSLQRRAVFIKAEGGGLAFAGFQAEAMRPEGGLRQAGAAPRFDFDPDEDAKRMESQMGQLQSSTQAGMAGFTSAILSGEQSVGSAFGSFFAMMGDQLIRLGIANIGLGTAGEALRAFVTNPAVAIAAGAALLAIGSQLRKKTRMAQANILSGSGGGISSGYSLNRNQFATSSSASVGYIAPPPPPRNPYAEIRMDAKDFVVSLDDARRELDVVT